MSFCCFGISVWMTHIFRNRSFNKPALWTKNILTAFSGLSPLARSWSQSRVLAPSRKMERATNPSWEVSINLVFPDLSRKWTGNLDFNYSLVFSPVGGIDMINTPQSGTTAHSALRYSHNVSLLLCSQPQVLSSAGMTVITHCCLFCSSLITFPHPV